MPSQVAAAAPGHDNDTGRDHDPDSGDFDDGDALSHLSEDGSAMTTETIDSRSVQSPSDRSRARPTEFRGADAPPCTLQNGPPHTSTAENHVPRDIIIRDEAGAPVVLPPANVPPQDAPAAPAPIPRGRSIAHHHIANKKAVFLSLDVETGGEFCGPSGLLQLSAELFRMEIKHNGWNDVAENMQRVGNVFNKYVNPGEGAIWNEVAAQRSHQLTASDPRIRNADDITIVWGQFETWIKESVLGDEVVILVAYNGETCDMKWLWSLTQAPRSPHNMPEAIQFFMDPLKVVRNYKRHPLHKAQLDGSLASLELGCVWTYLHGSNFNGAHDSLVDAKAQADVIVHQKFIPFIDRSKSVQEVSEIFSKTQRSEWRKKMEPDQPVHKPWMELDGENDFTWMPDRRSNYESSNGGPPARPSTRICQVARENKRLEDIFLFILPLSFFTKVAECTQQYCYDDWVVEREARDRDGRFLCTLPQTLEEANAVRPVILPAKSVTDVTMRGPNTASPPDTFLRGSRLPSSREVTLGLISLHRRRYGRKHHGELGKLTFRTQCHEMLTSL